MQRKPLRKPFRKRRRRTMPRVLGTQNGTGTSNQRPYQPAEVRRVRRNTLLTLYTVLAAEVAFALLTAPPLSIKRIQVRGVETLPEAEAKQILTATVLPAGTNWFRAPVGKLDKEVRKLPWVRSVTVSRQFPDGVRTQVVPREPAVIVQTEAGKYEVDADSVPIRLARPEMLPRLTLITLARPRPIQPGLALNDGALQAAIRTARTLGTGSVARIAKIEVDLTDNLCLNMQDGLSIRFGQADDLPAKVDLAQRLYRQEPSIANRLTEVNLTCPSMPACTPRVAETRPASTDRDPALHADPDTDTAG